MAEFNIRSDAVDVEQIMEQIRARVREKRGVDYTEDQIRELANVKLDRFLDPQNVRSGLLEHYREQHDQSSGTAEVFEPVAVPPFEPDDVYRSSRGGIGRVLQAIRRVLRPVLKLFINPGPMLEAVGALAANAENTNRTRALNQERNRARADLDVLTYEVMNNLVVEMTRLAIDLKNHKMRVESVAARLDFDERRARALEEIVQYRTSRLSSETPPAADDTPPASGSGEEGGPEKRRRRRRRGRRRSGNGAAPSADTADAASGDEPGGGSASSDGAGDAPAAASAEPRSASTPEPSGDTSES